MAILPANVLIADPASEWIRIAVPLVLQHDLSTSRSLSAAIGNSESGAYGLDATQTLRTTVQEQNQRLELRSTLTGTATQQIANVFTSQERSAALIPGLNALAKRVDGQACNFSTNNDAALKSFAAAVVAPDSQVRVQKLTDAISADPAFGLAYITLLEALAPSGGESLATVLRAANSHKSEFTPVDRARADALLSKLTQAPLSAQAKASAAVIQLAPNDTDSLASLASTLYLQRDSANAGRFISRAVQLSPNNANYRQQLGLGLIESRRFAEAEKILNSFGSNAAITPALAVCVLLEGDTARANAVFDAFVSSVPDPDAKAILRASWIAIAGRPGDAVKSLQTAQITSRGVTSLANAQIAVWQTMEGDQAAARKTAMDAAQSGTRDSAIAFLLGIGAQTPAEWRAKVEALPAAVTTDQAKRALLGYGFFLYGFYPEAAAAWEENFRLSGGADLRARIMLAASLSKAGRTAEANKLPVIPFVPDWNDAYAAVSFTQLRALLH